MAHLRILVSQPLADHPEQISVQLPELEVDPEMSELPFAKQYVLASVLKALDAVDREVDPSAFYKPELDWLRNEGLVVKDNDREYYSTGLSRYVGEALFNSLFPKGNGLRSAYDQVRRESVDGAVHIELSYASKSWLVGTQPWELLRDSNDFVCGGGRGSLTRYLRFDAPPVARRPPEHLSVLVITARPITLKDLPYRDLESIESQAQVGRLSVMTLDPPTREALRNYLRENGVPQIVHFDGHGAFGRRCWACGDVTQSRGMRPCHCGRPFLDQPFEGYLAFEHEQLPVDYVSARELADLFREEQPANTDQTGILLVVLSACRTGVARYGENAFNGTAQRLIDARVPAVVATQFVIKSRDASHFVRALYECIVARQPLRKAVSCGQTTLGREGDQWYRPVLYLRWRDNAGGQLLAAAQEDRTISDMAECVVILGSLSHAVPAVKVKVDRALATLQRVFPTLREINAFKSIHDKLHNLQLALRQSPPARDEKGRLRSTEEIGWGPFDSSVDALVEHVDSLIETVNRFLELDELGRLPQDAERAIVGLRAVSADGITGSEKMRAYCDAWYQVDAVLSRHMSPMNTGVVNTAKTLSESHMLEDILHDATDVVSVAMQHVAQTDAHKLSRLDQCLGELSALLETFDKLVKDHGAWQQIDSELAREEANALVAFDLDRFKPIWESLEADIRARYQQIGDASWAQPVADRVAKLNEILADGDSLKASRAQKDLHGVVVKRFNNVDKSLREQSDALVTKSQSLLEMLETIK
jgi:hypothetical protein